MATRDAPALHRRQLVIDHHPHRAAADWRVVDLGNGLVLSACPSLRVRRLPGEDPAAWLIGEAVPSAPGETEIALPDAARASLDGLVAATYGWAGRWALVSGRWLIPDPVNMMNLFHTQPAAGGGALVSGSLALLAGLRPDLPASRRRLWRGGFAWFPPPGSRLAGVDKLLPDQALDLASGAPVRIRRGRPAALAGAGLETLADSLLGGIARVLTHLAGERRLILPLTAGLDSRLLLAAALAGGVPVETLTLPYPGIRRADLELPPQLARHAGVRHRLVGDAPADPRRRRLFDRHCFGTVVDTDRRFFSRGLLDGVTADSVLVRSNLSELGRHTFQDTFAPHSWSDLARDPGLLARRYPDFASRTGLALQLGRWIAWVRDGNPRLGVIDAFFRDQRLCGWAACLEQGLDLMPGAAVQVLNSAWFHDLLLAPPLEDRAASRLHLTALARAGTGLERFALNPRRDRITDRLAAKLAFHAARLSNEPLNWPADRALARRLAAAGWPVQTPQPTSLPDLAAGLAD
jgi:hypothetical protein